MKTKKYKIRLLRSFDYEFLEIYNYIYYKLGNPIAAKNLIRNAHEAIEKRSYFPKSFQKFISKRLYEWYRIYIGNFTIFYTTKEDEMIVAHIIYSPRNIENLF